MGHRPRPRPKYLAAKLLAIRQQLGASQSEMIRLLGLQISGARISEYETGAREPSLLTLLAYARLTKVPVENLTTMPWICSTEKDHQKRLVIDVYAKY
jgi:transcriptional regulator with XRE-family HTH domain